MRIRWSFAILLFGLMQALHAQPGTKPLNLNTDSEPNAPSIVVMWYPGGDNWDLLRVQLSTESAIPFRGVLWVELDLESHWRRHRQRDDYRIERAVYVTQESSQLFDVLLPAQATFLGATLRAEGAPEDAKPACAIDAPGTGGISRHERPDRDSGRWIYLAESDMNGDGQMAFSAKSGTMRSLPTSTHYLADCDGIVVLEQRELPAETVALLADAVKAGATLITGAPTLEDSCPALLAKLFGEEYDAAAFAEDQEIYMRLPGTDGSPYFRTVKGRTLTLDVSRFFIQMTHGTGGIFRHIEADEPNNSEADELSNAEMGELHPRHRFVPNIVYTIGAGLVILESDTSAPSQDSHQGLEYFNPSSLFSGTFSTQGLAPVANLAQEYVFGPMAVTFLLLLYSALAGPVLFFVLRKRAPALLVPVGMAFCLVAVVLIFAGINVRRALAPDAIVIDVTVFGADGVPAKVHSIMSAGNVDLRRPNSHAITPIGDNTRLRPLVLSVTPAEQSVKDSGLGEWQATNLVIDAPPAKDQQPLSLTLRSDGSFVSSADLKFALVSNVASDVTAFDETSSGVCLLHDIKAGTPLKFSPMSPKELSGVIDTMDDEYQELFRRILYAGEYGNGSVIAIPADPGFLKPPHSDTFDVRRAAIAWLPLVREAPAREQP